MARKISKKDDRYLARLVTGERAPCAFCLREVDDEVIYGKLYAIGDIQCHYFCCLLSCCLIQKGHDEEGLFGFMYTDILAELERCKKHKCSYCARSGANLGCSVGACRKQFHVPCGRDKNAVSLYYGSYKSFCEMHAPKQKIPEHIMAKAHLRKRVHKIKPKISTTTTQDIEGTEEMVCVICYETVQGFPTVNTFWPPCCGKDAWFHRSCLQRMALSAGMHYLKCPLCNDKESFYDAVVEQGYYVPDRDAAWELEQNAFAEIYERAATCAAEPCVCPLGRSHDAENGKWDIKLCLLCGSAGAHAHCIDQSQPSKEDKNSLNQSQTEADSKEDNNISLEANRSRNDSALSMEQSNTSEQQNTSDKRNTSPDKSNTSPDNSNTSPDKLNTSPDKSNTSPDKSNTSPDNSNTSPDKSNTSPDNSNTSPDKSNTSPDNSNTSPDKLNTSPDKSNTSPDKSNTSPDNSNTSPDKSNTSPDNSNTSPDNSNTSPDKPNTSPDKPTTSPDNSNTSDKPNTSPDKPNISPDKSITSPDYSNTSPDKSSTLRFVCRSCLPAAPEDLSALAANIEAIIQQEQVASSTESRPVMPSRMSIRRTKGRRPIIHRPSTSRCIRTEADVGSIESPNVVSSRLELNLKPPRRPPGALGAPGVPAEPCAEAKLLSPLKLLEQSFREKMICSGVQDAVLDESIVDTLRRKFRKPRPMCERKRIVNNILDGIFDALIKDSKQKEHVKEWCSPKKSSLEYSKELNEFSNTLKESEECQDKENDSRLPNTPKDLKHNINEDSIRNLGKLDENIEYNVPEPQNYEDNIKNIAITLKFSNNEVIENKSPKYEMNETKTETIPKITELCRSKNIEVSKTDIETKHNNKIGKHSYDSENYTLKNNEIEDTIDSNENGKKTRNSTDTINYNNKNNSKHNSNIDNKIKVTSKSNNKSISELQNSKNNESEDIVQIDDSKTSNKVETKTDIADKKHKFTKKSLSLKYHSKKDKRKSRRGVEKAKNTPTKNNSNDQRKIRSKSESSADINILKRLLTEKDLCSQLLLELTTGKVGDKSVTNNSNTEAHLQSSSKQTPTNDNTKTSHETNHKTKKVTTPKSSQNTNKTLKDKTASKTTKTSIDSPTSQKTLNVLDNRNSTEDTTKQINKTDSEVKKSSESLHLDLNAQNILDSNLIDAPKHKTIEIEQDSSLEISENDQHINIDVIKIEDSPTTGDSYKKLKVKLPDQLKTCFKFSPIDENLDKDDVGIDLESFKKEYLSEVDREFKCNFKHKHVKKTSGGRRYSSPIDFALNAMKQETVTGNSKKRKLSENMKLVFDSSVSKRRKMSESDLNLVYDYDKNPENSEASNKTSIVNEGRKRKVREKCRRKTERRKAKRNRRKSSSDKNIEVTIDSSEKRSKNKRIKKKIKTKFAIQNQNIQVKIKWKKKQLSLNIESKKQVKKEKTVKDDSKFKQYVLQFPEGSSKEVLVKPEKEVCPLKRKYCRNEKSPDKFKQMSIQSFFKVKSES